MALNQELEANQLLQGLQHKDPRLYDLVNILVKNITAVDRQLNPVRTLSKNTTGGGAGVILNADDLFYQIQKRVSVRV